MQNTRLNSLVDVLLERTSRWLQNPWRRTSTLIISLLFGNFLATVIATTTGQTAEIDVLVSMLLVVLVELINWLVYRYRPKTDLPSSPARRWLGTEMLNALKMGLVYGLFVEAFKLGS